MVTQVVVTRSRHPLEGKSLEVLGRQHRRGRLELLVVLPDGSKTLLPAGWTDLEPGVAVSEPAIGSLSDLLAAVAVAAELSARREGGGQTARQSPAKENHRAAHPAQSDTRRGAGATSPAVSSLTRDPGGGRGGAVGSSGGQSGRDDGDGG